MFTFVERSSISTPHLETNYLSKLPN